MSVEKTLVMCSGGLDSTGTLLRVVRERGAENVAVIAFRYGQPAADAELYASQDASTILGVPWACNYLSDVMRGGVVNRVLPAGVDANGVNNANVPGRNLLFLSASTSKVGYDWPGKSVAIVIGAHVDDAATFPDCRPEFLISATKTARLALDGVVADLRIEAPWLTHRKADILRHFLGDEQALEILRNSVSCYSGTRCGLCGACVQRAEAFAQAGMIDGTRSTPKMHGGDPHRERRLGR